MAFDPGGRRQGERIFDDRLLAIQLVEVLPVLIGNTLHDGLDDLLWAGGMRHHKLLRQLPRVATTTEA
jgi:hypothetical protein